MKPLQARRKILRWTGSIREPTALRPLPELRDEGVSGFRAALDARGRLVVPAPVRDRLDIDRGDTVEVLIRRGDADG